MTPARPVTLSSDSRSAPTKTSMTDVVSVGRGGTARTGAATPAREMALTMSAAEIMWTADRPATNPSAMPLLPCSLAL